MVLDNAPSQRCALVRTHAAQLNIELLFLPAYSSNLTLIERLWKFVKKQCLYAKHYQDFTAFTHAIQRCLQEMHTRHKQALSSFLTLNFQTFEKAHFLTAQCITPLQRKNISASRSRRAFTSAKSPLRWRTSRVCSLGIWMTPSHGYNAKVLAQVLNARPADVHAFLRGQLPTQRTHELKTQLLIAGVPV